MSRQRETNPHFLELEPLQPQRPDRHTDHGPWLQIPYKLDRDRRRESRGHRYGQPPITPLPLHGGHRDQHTTTLPPAGHRDQHPNSTFPLGGYQDQHPTTTPMPLSGRQDQLSRTPSPIQSAPGFQYQESFPPSPRLNKPRGGSHPTATTFLPIPDQGQQHPPSRLHELQPRPSPDGQATKKRAALMPPPADYTPRSHQTYGPRLPSPKETKPHTWLIAVFCAVFWLIIILGGLAVLIVYLVFRPSDPRFDISTATLNAAYLDMGYLLNADVTILANFTNPNKKVSVDFSHLIVGLYYDNTLIGTTYIEPFKATSRESRFANIHMVTSQVRLPMKEIQHLKYQVQRNRITFEVRGWFRARSHLGDYLPYSYTLYSHCIISLTAPPDGALVAGHCRTKR